MKTKPVLRCQYCDEDNASITKADAVAISQLQRNASLAICSVTQTRVTQWSRYHSDVNHCFSLTKYQNHNHSQYIHQPHGKIARLGSWVRSVCFCYRCATNVEHIHIKKHFALVCLATQNDTSENPL